MSGLEITQDFATTRSCQTAPDIEIDVVADKPHRTVAHRYLNTTDMLAA